MVYEAKNLDNLLGTEGFSDQSLQNHFTLYQGYVANTNKLTEKLEEYLKEGKTGDSEYAELKRRFGWEFNGMRLHENYFGNLTKGGKELDKDSNLRDKIVEDFGSYENWEKDFKALGAMRGIGWAVLYCDCQNDKLFNVWINEHDLGHLAGAIPVLVMDVFEHAFIPDYGLKKADYIEAFFKAIDWDVAEERFDNA
ncbi:superoxide dismutase [Fe] [bacterium BMS3Abin15]|nr:superoxide dismutase [Fe] [bacterium BMS3Abin15]HDH07394.1 superoxide dismutase [Candidatus Moranbacteria bacterium]